MEAVLVDLGERVFHKDGSMGRQGATGRAKSRTGSASVSLLPDTSNPRSDLKILLETADTTRTLSSGTGRLSPWGSVDEFRLGESLMLERVFGTRSKERSEPVQDENESRRDTGAAMVEMAFIFTLLVMLLVGVVTAAIAFGHKNSIENAAREASRYAATLGPPIDNAWLETVRNVAQEAAQGNLDPGVEGQHICVAHFGKSGWQRLLQDDGDPTPDFSTGVPCFPDGLSDSRVQVETGRGTEINAAFFSVDVTLNAPATARYERVE